MRIFDLLGLIFYNLSRRKGRVVLTAVGVVIGTAAVVILVSLAGGLQRSATSQLWGMNDLTSISVSPQWVEQPMMNGGMAVSGPSFQKLITDSVIDEFIAIPHVTQVITRDSLKVGAIMRYGRLETWPYIQGLGVDDVAALNFPIQAGTSKLEKGTILIGAPLLRQFMDPNQRPGQEPPEPPDLLDKQVRLVLMKYTSDGMEIKKTVILRVAGIMQETRGESDYSMFVPIADLTAWNEWAMGKRINRNRDGYDTVTVKVDSADNVIDVTDQITEMNFQAYTSQEIVQSISSFYMIVQIIFGGVGAVALLVAAIGIANTMTMSILERTREIGLMKAIGATNRNVLSIFLGEAAGIGFVGGLGGVAAGLLVDEAINIAALPYMLTRAAEMGTAPPESVVFTPVWLPVFAVLFATLIGFLSGLYPALRAATLIPVIALKYE